jgi:fatty acid desaturase
MVPSYNLRKLHNIIKEQIPLPFPSLFSFYKQVLPIVIKQATNPSIYFKTSLPEKTK